jgi:hypothetical protein
MTNGCVKELVDFIKVFQILPHVSTRGCHLQGVVGTLEATQAVSVLWAYTGYGLSSVASCGHFRVNNWTHWTDHNPMTTGHTGQIITPRQLATLDRS